MTDTPRHEYAPAWETRTDPTTGDQVRVRLASCPPCGWKADTVVAGLPERIDQYNTHKIVTDHKHTT